MEKSKEIYDHLAKVYLGSSRNKKENNTHIKRRFGLFFKIGLAVFVIATAVLFTAVFWQGKSSQSNETTKIIGTEIAKLNFNNFTSIKKEVVSLDVKEIHFTDYKTLRFLARKSNFDDKILLRVEMVDRFGKQSKVYINQLPAFQWADFEIKLTDFKGTCDISQILSLALMVEDWDTKKGNAALYIDSIRLEK